MAVGGDIAVAGEDEAAAGADGLPLDLLAEDVIAHSGQAGGVDADAAVYVGLVDLGEGQLLIAGDGHGVQLGFRPVADVELAVRACGVLAVLGLDVLGGGNRIPAAVYIPTGPECAADEQRPAEDHCNDLARPVPPGGLDLRRGGLGLEAVAVRTVAVVVFAAASVLLIIIVIHRNVLLVNCLVRARRGRSLLMVLGYRGFMTRI